MLSKHQWMTEDMEEGLGKRFKCLYFLQFCNLCSGTKITHLSFKRWLVVVDRVSSLLVMECHIRLFKPIYKYILNYYYYLILLFIFVFFIFLQVLCLLSPWPCYHTNATVRWWAPQKLMPPTTGRWLVGW